MIFVSAVVIGVVLGILIPYNLTTATLPYVAVAIVAALDSVFGGLLAYYNKKFNMSIFITGLFSNAILAVIMTYVGNLLGISLYFAVIVVFGVRIFNNMASIRRITFDKYFEKKIKEKEIKRHKEEVEDETDADNKEAEAEVKKEDAKEEKETKEE